MLLKLRVYFGIKIILYSSEKLIVSIRKIHAVHVTMDARYQSNYVSHLLCYVNFKIDAWL